jgi:hypothetical protein
MWWRMELLALASQEIQRAGEAARASASKDKNNSNYIQTISGTHQHHFAHFVGKNSSGSIVDALAPLLDLPFPISEAGTG